jgi:hypothetical protein
MLSIWAATSVLAAALVRDMKSVIIDRLFNDIGIFAVIAEEGRQCNELMYQHRKTLGLFIQAFFYCYICLCLYTYSLVL